MSSKKKIVPKNKYNKKTNDDHDKYIVKDFYKISDKVSSKNKIKYIQKSNIIKHPARILIVAPSGSGKTNLATFIALDLLSWQDIYIFAKNTEQPLFELIKDYLNLACEEKDLNIDDYFHMSDEIDVKINDKNEDGSNVFNSREQHLVVFDDMSHKDDKKNSFIVSTYLKWGRPANTSVIVTTQNFFDTTKNVRENAIYVICFKGKSPKDIDEIRKWYADDLSKDEFQKYYQIATQKEYDDDKNAFLFIDTTTNDKSLKYRRGFVPRSLIKDNNSTIVDNLGPLDYKHTKDWNKKSINKYSDSDSD